MNRREAFKVMGAVLVVATVGTVAAKDGYLVGLEGELFATSTLVAVAAPEHGAVAVTFIDQDGQRFTADLLHYDPETPGVARAGSVAIHTRGRGRTNQAHGLAVMALADVLASREADGATVPKLATLRDRDVARTRHLANS